MILHARAIRLYDRIGLHGKVVVVGGYRGGF